MTVRTSKQTLKHQDISIDALSLQKKLQEHMLKRLEDGLSHHTKAFSIGISAFYWSFLVVYVPLTIFLVWGTIMLFMDFDKLEAAFRFLMPQGFSVSLAVLCAPPLAIFVSLSKYNRIDAGKEDASKISDYIPTSGFFKDL